MLKRLKQKLIYWLCSKLLPVIKPEDLIAFTKNGKVFVGGKELAPNELNNLRSEADILGKLQIWDLIVNKLNEKSQKKMYLDAIDATDMIVGKTILYVLNFQKEILDKLKH